ncbi:MAG: polysaccharide biosynthesis tyrosine autokinase [Microthrixaceae bacterium]
METFQDRSDTNVEDYLGILRRRWQWPVVGLVIAVAVSLALSLSQQKIYQASAQLLLQPEKSENIFSNQVVGGDPARAVQNELKVINSRAIQAAVTKAYGAPLTVAAVSGGDDDIIILSATDTVPERAARKVNVYAETYQSERLDATIADLAKTKRVVQNQIDDFQKQINDVNKPIAELDAKIAGLLTTDPQYAELTAQRQQLVTATQSKRNDLEQQLNDYQQRQNILQLSERLTTTGGVQILNPATTPSTPISPKPLRDAMQAAIVGLLLGVALAFLIEQADDRVRTVSDLERAARDLPVLGMIPVDDAWKNRAEPRVTTLEAPMSATAEAYRGIRTSLQYLALQRPIGVVQVTSATADEGKSSMLSNLAVAFAEAGMKVAVVGCDLRKPRTHQFFQVDGSVGLTSVLLGRRSLDECLQVSPVHPNITVLASGPRPPNPSELLGLDSTNQIIRSLLNTHSIVFVDSTPVLPVTDALVLARTVDATLFLTMVRKTSRRQVRHSLDRLHQVQSPLLGTILNGVEEEAAYGALYEYYGYVDTPNAPFRRIFRRKRHSDVPRLDDVMVDEAAGERSRADQPGGVAAPSPTPGATASHNGVPQGPPPQAPPPMEGGRSQRR